MTNPTADKTITVYIAGPYTKGDTVVNIRNALEAADEIIRRGYVPFIPHLNGFWHLVAPKSYSFWMGYDMVWLEKCDCVLRLPGESHGADMEVENAIDMGIPVFETMDVLDSYWQTRAREEAARWERRQAAERN